MVRSGHGGSKLLGRRQVALGAAAVVSATYGCKMEPAPSPSPTADPSRSSLRPVARIVPGTRTRDGAGVSLLRALGGGALAMLDPFLLLDEIRSDDPNDYVAGFPRHPHRGFETVTYMIDGAMEHADSVGNRGRLSPGSAQWMTAGHGIVHSEMPRQERGLMWGYQLWVNLPRASKMRRPRYQNIEPARIPSVERDRALVRVLAGTVLGVTGPVSGIDVEPIFVDVSIARGGSLEIPLPSQHQAFALVIDGALRLGPSRTEVRRGRVAVLGGGDRALAACDADSGRMLLLAGRPLGEPVARRGPFVMNTEDELRQAFEDYRSGRLAEQG